MHRAVLIGVAVAIAMAPACARAAGEDEQHQLEEVAKSIYLATLVPDMCPTIKANYPVIQNFMDMANFTISDFTPKGKYGAVIAATDAYFKGEYAKDKDKACNEVFATLGTPDINMLTRK